ncbi:unnamed protein product [Onchocerca flexuosa]|uniref:Lactamase_B domain-containing protein n=1 Tax=Onchocerca flexuosa TaxID=387005 RepID=A0A183H4A3_9BILA|nr:unnamed protein product [Onchocerca flexuosa]
MRFFHSENLETPFCPFDANPLILMSGEYITCKPAIAKECPSGFVCDFSVVLGQSICCQDMRNQPMLNIKIKIPSTTNATSTPSSTVLPTRSNKMKTQHHFWLSTIPNRQSPWYIKDRKPLYKTGWNETTQNLLPSRTITTTSATVMSKSHELPPTTESTIDVDNTEISVEEHSNTTNKITTINKQQEIPCHNRSEHGVISTKISQTVLPDDYATSVSFIQVGNIKRLTDSQTLIVGAITLINDHGYRILVDTGSAADTELLLQGLSKEMITMDDIAVVVVTSGHPSYTGNLNLFPMKPTLFHTMEYLEQQATITDLKDVCVVLSFSVS